MSSLHLLRVRALSKTYQAGLLGCTASARAFHAVDLEIKAGEVVAIVGPANAGKTTLLLCAAGLLAPDEGAIERGGIARYVSDPVHLCRACADDVRWDLALVDEVDRVCGDVAAAFALLSTAKRARKQGGSLVLAARDTRAIANVADRVLLLERGRLTPVTRSGHAPLAAKVAEASLR